MRFSTLGTLPQTPTGALPWTQLGAFRPPGSPCPPYIQILATLMPPGVTLIHGEVTGTANINQQNAVPIGRSPLSMIALIRGYYVM